MYLKMEFYWIVAGFVFFLAVTGVSCQSAVCNVAPNSDLPEEDKQPISGTVTFTTDSNSDTEVTINLAGFNTTDSEDVHGFHIHELGDLSNGCTSTGSHYNPMNVDHGGRENVTRHVGDLGNIEEDRRGNVNTTFTDSVIKLSGEYSILNRAVVIHATFDDLGASGDAAGAAGARLACCIVTDTADSSAINVMGNLVLLVAACIVSTLNVWS